MTGDCIAFGVDGENPYAVGELVEGPVALRSSLKEEAALLRLLSVSLAVAVGH